MIILVNLIFFIGAYLYLENTFLKKTEYTIYSKKLPKAFDGFKIAQISDVHNTRSRDIKKSIVKHLDEAAVDITVITGDLFDSRRTNLTPVIELMDMIKGLSIMYYIPGNHESRKPDVYNALKTTLYSDYNVKTLDNKREKLQRNNSHIYLYGLRDCDFYMEEQYVKDAFDEQKKITEKTVRNLRIDMSRFSILLAHRPEFFDVYSKSGANLILSGHAHGGQIRIPFVGGLVAPNQGYFPKLTSGVHEKNKAQMVISRGIGNSVFPFRINNRPELVIITLKTR